MGEVNSIRGRGNVFQAPFRDLFSWLGINWMNRVAVNKGMGMPDDWMFSFLVRCLEFKFEGA